MSRNCEKNLSDYHLWEKVTLTVKPYNNRKKKSESIGDSESKPEQRKTQPIITYSAQTEIENKDFSKKSAEKQTQRNHLQPGSGIDRNTYSRFCAGKMPIEGILDLHGMREDEAHNAFIKFVLLHKTKASRCLLVITGKGKSKESEGKLRRMLPLWIGLDTISPHVLTFAMASSKDGGSGAWYILLRRTRIMKD